MANGVDLNGDTANGRWLGLPAWAKFVALIGPSAAIALYAVWIGGQTLPRIEQETQLLHASIEKNQELIREVRLQQQENYRLLLRICVQISKPDQLGQCFTQQ